LTSTKKSKSLDWEKPTSAWRLRTAKLYNVNRWKKRI